jgi:hypothetical protein
MDLWAETAIRLLSILAPLAGGLFALMRYLDTRNREAQEARNERYAATIREMSGLRADGSRTFLVENVAAIYRLTEFPEKRDVSLTLLEVSLSQPHWKDMLGPHAERVMDELRRRR